MSEKYIKGAQLNLCRFTVDLYSCFRAKSSVIKTAKNSQYCRKRTDRFYNAFPSFPAPKVISHLSFLTVVSPPCRCLQNNLISFSVKSFSRSPFRSLTLLSVDQAESNSLSYLLQLQLEIGKIEIRRPKVENWLN